MSTRINQAAKAAQDAARDKTNGQFGQQQHSAPGAPLDATAPEPTQLTFEDMLKPNQDDLASAYERVRDELSPAEYGFEQMMGRGVRRTEKNLAEYHALVDAVIDGDEGHSGRVQRYARISAELDAYARAYEQGVPIHPVAEAYFEGAWSSGSEFGIRRKLEENREMRRRLDAGRLRPAQIVGGGRKAAEEYLEQRESDLARALATRGRSQTALASNVAGVVRRYEQAARDGS